MVVSVRGEGLEPFKRLASVEDELEFIALMRLRCIQSIIRAHPDMPFTEAMLRSINVSLKDTGFTEYPETDKEAEDLLRRF